ncbi:MAG: extracellular solute-binding protein [Candidatus Jorgensenbacteria bacterium]
MSLTKNQIVIVGVAGFVVLALILIFFGIIPGLKDEDPRAKVGGTLELWGVFDNEDAYVAAIASFNSSYPAVKVNYRRFNDAAEYERSLIDALAAGKGPDIFMMRNRALPRDVNKIAPVSAAKFSILGLRNLFPQVVEQDFVSSGAIYALPVSIDTLALYYNQEHFDAAAIASPPLTWEEFNGLISKLVKKDKDGKITRAAAAIGGSASSVEDASDILSLLMLQTGTKMVDDGFARAEFDSPEGGSALKFYVGFADPESAVYTWNDSLGESLDAFAEENASMMFGYASDSARLGAKNPFLNFAVSGVPQPEEAERVITYPEYWGYAVSRQSRRQSLAWEFILNFATNKDNAKSFIEKTDRPPALRTLIDEKTNDPNLSVFAKQALTARSWLQADPDAISGAFSEMIESVVSGGETVSDALDKTEQEVTNLMERRL